MRDAYFVSARLRSVVATCCAVACLPACGPKIVVVDRPSCEACHRPLRKDGTAVGIEHAHPDLADGPLACVDCHGGDDTSYVQSQAHVSPGPGGERYLRNLTIEELDAVRPEYLRFINPGDLRVASRSCGSASPRVDGSGCHQGILDRVIRNQMATFSGELGVARFRAGVQRRGAGVKGIYDVEDPDYVAGAVPGTVGRLSKMEEPRIAAGETEIGPYQDLYLTKACMRCHLWSFGDNKFRGDYRSSGCSACHMVYDVDGFSRSGDPLASGAPGHPVEHRLTRVPPTEQCLHCHYRGGRLGPAFLGYREGAGPGMNPPNAEYLGETLHGHDASFYVKDEDSTNTYDETPPDVHREAGMDCVDCHTEADVHGDGHIYADTASAIEIRCESCHGTIDAPSTLETARGRPLQNLSRDADGTVWLTTKRSGTRLKVPQIAESLAQADPASALHRSMGRDANGFSHAESLECYTCHAAWIPTCYGCHVSVDMREVQRSLVSGRQTPGAITGTRRWVAVDDLILLLDTEGRIAPSQPSEKMFFNAIDGDGVVRIDKRVRTGPGGQPGMGQRAFQPHSIRRWSPFMRCTRCHPVEGTFENQERVYQAIGLGTDRYLETDGAGKTWSLDRILSDTYAPQALIGHDEPKVSRPLTPEIIGRMLGVEVPAPACDATKAGPTTFAAVQDAIFSARCTSTACHGGANPAAGLDLTPGQAYASLVGVQATGAPSGTMRVTPGDPGASYLLAKIDPAAKRAGLPMPAGGQPLRPCEIEMVRGWIANGARP